LLLVVLAVFAGLLPLVLVHTGPARAVAVVPPGFDDMPVTDVARPTALAFTPDGRLLITTQPGQLRVYDEGTPGTTLAYEFRNSEICSKQERGLLGVAVDPNFDAQSPGEDYVYLYYTFEKFGMCLEKEPANKKNPVNRVSRFTMQGDSVLPGSEEILIDNIRSPNGNHNGGDLHFGKDGHLYVSIGDGGCDYAEPTNCQYENDASRDRHMLLGKILRVGVDADGTTFIPEGNPYTGPDSERCNLTGRTERGKNCRETFARGLRNPFRMAFDPDAEGASFRINDVGGAHREEIDTGKNGADYGWNLCEGRRDNRDRRGSVKCSQPPYTPPIHEYSHRSGCKSITGGAFVPNSAAWPGYEDAYLFGDFVCGKIFSLKPDGRGYTRTAFATGLGETGPGPVSMTFGPSPQGQALYYTTFAGGGEVRRIAQTAGSG
jgi:glucose/arabinose dehydrogenase